MNLSNLVGEYADMYIDSKKEKEEHREGQSDGKAYFKGLFPEMIGGKSVIQLKKNKIPKGLVPL